MMMVMMRMVVVMVVVVALVVDKGLPKVAVAERGEVGKARCTLNGTRPLDGEERAVQKETTGKKSKRGRLTVELEDGEYKTYQSGQGRWLEPQDLLGDEVFRDGQSCRTECFSDIRARIAEAHIRELRKAMAAITSDAKRLKTDALPVPTKTDDASIEKAAVDGTAVTGSA